ncbi:39S ribosomal protein L54, mitochondrial [Nilaparvata lugens]|uniref:39S ribosomal protein L54, mitochondrial n=1 Tax=Nilaparvata lugens TaxID=108931 RepID=UPI00193E0551|nr:39S ribosomal protein L54, mitochondrial [Nilaparvata lugens]
MAALMKLLERRLLNTVNALGLFPNHTIVCNYAAPNIASLGKSKKLKAGAAPVEKKRLPVETDINKLVTFCCGTNILKEGGQDIKLQPDSEYPDWLWQLHIGKPKTLDEMDPNTLQYWRKVRKGGMKRRNLLLSKRKKTITFDKVYS